MASRRITAILLAIIVILPATTAILPATIAILPATLHHAVDFSVSYGGLKTNAIEDIQKLAKDLGAPGATVNHTM